VAALCFLVAWFMWRSIWLRYRHRHPRSSPARCIRQAAAAVDYVPGTRSAETSPTPIFSTLLALPVPERKHCELPGWVEHGDLGNRSALPCHTSKSATHPRFVVTNTCPCLLPLSEFRRSDRVNRACEAEASSHARMRPSRTDPVNPVPVLSAVVSTLLISVSSWWRSTRPPFRHRRQQGHVGCRRRRPFGGGARSAARPLSSRWQPGPMRAAGRPNAPCELRIELGVRRRERRRGARSVWRSALARARLSR
jgi:hypothetical protein